MTVKVKVIGLDSDKISLSIKRLKENPWDVLAKKFKLNDSITAPISRISKFGAFMDLEGGIQGLIHLSEISHGVVKDIREYVKIGEEVTAKIINFEPNKKRIGLSLKALQEAPKNAPKKEDTKEGEEDKIDAEVAKTKKAPAKKTEAKKETK
jgi:ribosomal protein S1